MHSSVKFSMLSLDCGFGIADLVLTNKTFELTPFAHIFSFSCFGGTVLTVLCEYIICSRPLWTLSLSYFFPVGVGTLSGLICRATANRNKITLTNCMVLICIFFVCRMWVNPANYHMYSDKYTNWTGCFLTSWLLSSVCEFPALLELVLMSFCTYQFQLSWMFLLEQQARKAGWQLTRYDEYACAQCRARADLQQVAASTMFMYLYLYLGF
jgi:hypothetical protein